MARLCSCGSVHLSTKLSCDLLVGLKMYQNMLKFFEKGNLVLPSFFKGHHIFLVFGRIDLLVLVADPIFPPP